MKENSFAIYAEQGIKTDQNSQQFKKRRTRSDQLCIDSKKNITPKNKLENHITKIIKIATSEIRLQARQIDWKAIKYNLRIKPSIPELLVNAIRKDSEYVPFMDEILNSCHLPVSTYLSLFEEHMIGQAVYRLKCLEQAGVIDVRKKLVIPTIYCNYFDKAKFMGSGN